ncbi:MAG: nucleotide sugar dehydrogenase [Holosporales bacterium]|jgi:UDP-N-acetyl-D-galactosamine dehydrogenase|nr:nucleotide sugar dehydrogenase [Holosporales bacterium]
MGLRKVSVVGLGYVGLPVAVAFGKRHNVVGFDINALRIDQLIKWIDITGEVETGDLKEAQIEFTSDPDSLKKANFHIVCVPTPVDEFNEPNFGPLVSASKIVGTQLKSGDIVVYESTVYPGATEEKCVPVLEQCSGLKFGQNFTVGYSPERINPGDKQHKFTTIRKVVSGSDAETVNIIKEVYSSVVEAGIFCAKSIKVAEAAKVIENTQRDINIALMNELSLIFNRLGIDTQDVLDAAETKWNFLPFKPGLVGGHCIGVDPYYLTHKAKAVGYNPEVILSGRRINDSMGEYIAQNMLKILVKNKMLRSDLKIAVLGMTFKENVPDLRNSKVYDIVKSLQELGIDMVVTDPYADKAEMMDIYGLVNTDIGTISNADVVILAVAHRSFVDQSWNLINRLIKPSQCCLVMDIKSVLDRDQKPENVLLWRL